MAAADDAKSATVKLTAVRVTGFRNLDCTIEIAYPLSLVVGENNTGKSNLIDAIRLLLRPLGGPHEGLWPRIEDFTHDIHGATLVDRFEVEAVFTGLSPREQGRMISCLAPDRGAATALLTMVATLSPTGVGGDGALRFARPLVDLRPVLDEQCNADLVEGHPAVPIRLGHLLGQPTRHDDHRP